MNHKKERLEQLRAQLQTKLKAKEFLENQISPFLEIQNHLRHKEVAFTILDLLGFQEEWLPYLEEELLESYFPALPDDLGQSKAVKLVHTLFDKYPTTNEFRYEPNFEKINLVSTQEVSGLKQTVKSLGLENQTVYLYYLQYTPLVQLELYDLFLVDNEDLFNFWFGDVVIFPENHSWLISYSLEEDWYAGRLNPIT
tara:strand:+ start:712 stop:1302 length:591 start_codon:yes stop_codon:yes gene_type:complete